MSTSQQKQQTAESDLQRFQILNYQTWNSTISKQQFQYVKEIKKFANISKKWENHQADLKNNELLELLEMINKEAERKKFQWMD